MKHERARTPAIREWLGGNEVARMPDARKK